jgi:hypothetical protein
MNRFRSPWTNSWPNIIEATLLANTTRCVTVAIEPDLADTLRTKIHNEIENLHPIQSQASIQSELEYLARFEDADAIRNKVAAGGT